MGLQWPSSLFWVIFGNIHGVRSLFFNLVVCSEAFWGDLLGPSKVLGGSGTLYEINHEIHFGIIIESIFEH